jgi:hypothetical protein
MSKLIRYYYSASQKSKLSKKPTEKMEEIRNDLHNISHFNQYWHKIEMNKE